MSGGASDGDVGDDARRGIPEHLRALLGDDPEGELSEALSRALDGAGAKLRTGRVSRAFGLSKLAVGSGSRVLLQKAREKLGGETRSEESVRQGQALALSMIETLSEMRGVAMKLGQMLSYLEDVMPPEAKRVLAVLQRDAPPMDWSEVAVQFEAELGAPPEALFAEFDHRPMAAASIGQVHRAVTKDGLEVAVKIQYPGIAEAMRADLQNARMMSLFQQLLFFRTNTKAIMAELEARLLDECDYRKEAAYQRLFAERFRDHPSIVVPDVIDALSTEKVLTTRLERGRTFYEWLATEPSETERLRAIHTFYRFYLGSFYMDGLFNCDPHPGNYLFRDDGRIVFLDYGCSRAFPPERRALWTEMCLAVHRDEPDELRRLAVQVGFFSAETKYDYEAYRKLIRYLYQAYLLDEPFDFKSHHPSTTFRQMFTDNPNLFKLDMPADAVFLNRITFGLVSLLSEIGGALNCYRHCRAYFVGIDPDWPEDHQRPADADATLASLGLPTAAEWPEQRPWVE